MHLVIINASPRVETKSNTARIIRAFVRGFEVNGNTTEVWHLSDKKQWTGAKEAFEKNDNILFAIPLYARQSAQLADAGHRAEPLHRLRERSKDRQEGI